MQEQYRILLMHPMDPRGVKLGGIETHVRMILSRHPADFSILFVGIDEFGDLPEGAISKVNVEGRDIDFMPVAGIDASHDVQVCIRRASQHHENSRCGEGNCCERRSATVRVCCFAEAAGPEISADGAWRRIQRPEDGQLD
jgi:hypothetical protein